MKLLTLLENLAIDKESCEEWKTIYLDKNSYHKDLWYDKESDQKHQMLEAEVVLKSNFEPVENLIFISTNSTIKQLLIQLQLSSNQITDNFGTICNMLQWDWN